MAKSTVAALPPIAGLPRAVGGKPLAWTKPGYLGSTQCAGCGQPYHYKSIHPNWGILPTAVLCGRCSLVLADQSGPQVVHLSPEEQAKQNRLAHRKATRGRR